MNHNSIFSPITPNLASCFFEGASFTNENGIKIINLTGSWRTMGRQFGHLAKPMLKKVLLFVYSKIGKCPEKNSETLRVASKLYSHYPESIQDFYAGMIETSGLTLEELQIVNAVEYIESLYNCSALVAWGDYAESHLVYGRNYDAMSFGSLADCIVTTVFHPSDDSLSFAIIGYAGEVYAVNGINSKGIFLELNNGMPSAGWDIDYDVSTCTTELLLALPKAHDIEYIDKLINSKKSSSSAIIGVANKQEARSYEWCSMGSKRADGIMPDGLLIITNHYVNPEWPFPIPSNDKCWQSLERRNNLAILAEKFKGKINFQTMQKIMETPIAEGGPMFTEFSLYQLVFEPELMRIWIQIPSVCSWRAIDIKSFLD